MKKTTKPMTPEQYLDHRLPRGSAARLQHENELARLRAIDLYVRTIEAEREAQHLSKEEVAAKANLNPAVVRRLLTAKDQNPSLKTLTAVAHGLGLTLRVAREDSRAELSLADDHTSETSPKKLSMKRQNLPVL